jgi:hypothetical protein
MTQKLTFRLLRVAHFCIVGLGLHDNKTSVG